MGPHPVELTIKSILSEKTFDFRQFIAQEFSDFLTQIRSYLSSAQRTIWGTKYANGRIVVNALSKIFEYTTSTDFLPENIVQLNMIFCFFLHPGSTKTIRESSITLLFKLLLLLADEVIEGIEGVFPLIVPFSCFARTDAEKDIFYRPMPSGIQPVIESGTNPSNHEDAINALHQLWDFLIVNWNSRPYLCSQILFKYLFAIIFPDIYEKIKVASCGYSFVAPSPQFLHQEVSMFLISFCTNKNNILSLFSTKNCLLFMQQLLEKMAVDITLTDSSVVFMILQDMIMNDEAVNSIVERSYKSFMRFADIMCIVLTAGTSNGRKSEEILKSSNMFLSKFFPLILVKIPRESIVEEIISLFHRHHYDKFASAFIMVAFLHSLMMSKSRDADLWECLTHLSIESQILSAVACRYAQYLVFLAFPQFLEIDEAQMKSISYKISQRQKSYFEDIPYGQIVDHAGMIFEAPNEFVRLYLQSSWEPYQEFDDVLKELDIPRLETNIKDKIELFLSAFDFYDQLESKAQKIAAFAPIYSYCQTFAKFCFLPPGLKRNHPAIYGHCQRRLFHGILCQNYNKISFSSFKVLATIVNNTSIKEYITYDQILQWLISICLMIFSEDKQISKFGFEQALLSVKRGLTAISMLAPVLINYLEKNIVDIKNDNEASFVASLPLFNEVKVSTLLTEKVEMHLKKNPQIYIDNAFSYFDANNLRERAFVLLEKMSDNECFLNTSIIMLADEMTQDEIDEKHIKIIFDGLVKSLQKNLNTVHSITSMFIFCEDLKKRVQNCFINFVTAVVNFTVSLNKDEKTKNIFYISQLAAHLCIHAGSLLDSQVLIKFIDFCTELVSTDTGNITFDVSSLATNLETLIAIYQNAYPYPSSPLFPMSQINANSINENESLRFTTPSRTILSFDYAKNSDGIEIAAQTNVGIFNWKMKNISGEMIHEEEKPVFDFNFTDMVVEPKKERRQQTVFSAAFNEVVSSFEEEGNLILISESLEEEQDSIEFTLYEPKTAQQDGARPSGEGNSLSAVATILGYTDIKDKERNENIENIESFEKPSKNEVNDFKLLKIDQQSQLKLQKLSSMNHRNDIKIGVLYTSCESESQHNILSESFETTSPHFKELLHGIGWPIDLSTHSGFDGCLDMTAFKSGMSSIYYADFECQVMYHVAPLIPLSQDEQQINRKRHIGNDPIQIIWCEKDMDYNPFTIISQFNQAHVIIYPLDTALFRVDVKFKNGAMNWFGPLRNSTVVNKKALPALVRQTAITAQLAYNINIEPLYDKLTIISNLTRQIRNDQEKKELPKHSEFFSLLNKNRK